MPVDRMNCRSSGLTGSMYLPQPRIKISETNFTQTKISKRRDKKKNEQRAARFLESMLISPHHQSMRLVILFVICFLVSQWHKFHQTSQKGNVTQFSKMLEK